MSRTIRILATGFSSHRLDLGVYFLEGQGSTSDFRDLLAHGQERIHRERATFRKQKVHEVVHLGRLFRWQGFDLRAF